MGAGQASLARVVTAAGLLGFLAVLALARGIRRFKLGIIGQVDNFIVQPQPGRRGRTVIVRGTGDGRIQRDKVLIDDPFGRGRATRRGGGGIARVLGFGFGIDIVVDEFSDDGDGKVFGPLRLVQDVDEHRVKFGMGDGGGIVGVKSDNPCAALVVVGDAIHKIPIVRKVLVVDDRIGTKPILGEKDEEGRSEGGETDGEFLFIVVTGDEDELHGDGVMIEKREEKKTKRNR